VYSDLDSQPKALRLDDMSSYGALCSTQLCSWQFKEEWEENRFINAAPPDYGCC